MLNRKETNGVNYCHFFYPELKNQFSKKDEISIDPELLDNYENKREIGQNDSYICRLIRQDLIEEFIKYTTQAGYNLSSFICHSIFETNVYLLKKEDISLIEYAAFFGSIQIIKYLVAKGVELTTSLWLYSIHSNNPDLIHFLEDSHLKLDEDLFDECIKESIKCHHNNFANYFITNRKNEIESLNDALPFFDEPDDQVCKAVIPFAFPLHDNSDIVHLLLKLKGIEIQKRGLCQNCEKLTKIEVPSSIKSIGKYYFEGCCSLTQVTIPSSVKSIGSHAFEGCSSLVRVTIPSSVKSIEKKTFYKCCSLTQVTIPSSVNSIGEGAFCECSSMVQIVIPESVTSIGWSAFSKCSSLEHVSLPSSVKKIGCYAFRECSSLVQISIPDSLVTIEEGVFKDCSSLSHVAIPFSVKTIKWDSFNGCSSLSQIRIAASVSLIEKNAFPKNTKFTSF
ncbi:hypothetical protein M9Y10_040619 [Tritrichomonas musculus]|uniref:Uncharacterized protein n=1 Tax=Tritrichomonas musculus TaxID=1915356 RepID=A0ABR2GPJ8_9EUKA